MLRNVIAVSLFMMIVSAVIGPSETAGIYRSLAHCYKGNNTQKWIGNTFQVLLELIRKVEDAYPTSIDMRTLSASIVHQLRIDGIERARGIRETEFTIPYGASGTMNPKFQILLNLISDTPGLLNFTEILTPSEVCTFHRLISSSVDAWQRGDEATTCPVSVKNDAEFGQSAFRSNKVRVSGSGKLFVVPAEISVCPIENGIVRTFDYGTISPGIVIASIAAGLQQQSVQIRELFQTVIYDYTQTTERIDKLETMQRRAADVEKMLASYDTIDNIYAAGIAGDLAEVCVYQLPYAGANVSVGLSGQWDDIYYPRSLYLSQNHFIDWQMTDSELLAGIDGYHLASQIHFWVNRVQRLRLSQVLEMYYSTRGVPTLLIENINRKKRPEMGIETDPRFWNRHQNFESDMYAIGGDLDSACQRKQILERIKRADLKDQTFFFAQILQFSVPSINIEETLFRSACDAAVDRFFDRAHQLLNELSTCESIQTNYEQADVELIVIIDGSRIEFETLKMISVLTEYADVSSFGSSISVINGETGLYMVQRTFSITDAFEELRLFDGFYPTSLSLSSGLSALIPSLENGEYNSNSSICQQSRVVLVVSQTQRIGQDDFANSKSLLETSLRHFPDIYYIFLTNDANSIRELFANIPQAQYVLQEQYSVIQTTSLDPDEFLLPLTRILKKIPKRVILPPCGIVQSDSNINPNEFEDYVSPNHARTYQVNAIYLQNVPMLRIEVEDTGYGSLTVCLQRNPIICQSTTVVDVVQFNISQPCQLDVDPVQCSSVAFTVELDVSNMKCSENDCRYPDQVRYLVRVYNEECRTGGSAHQTINCAVSFLLLLVNVVVVKFIF